VSFLQISPEAGVPLVKGCLLTVPFPKARAFAPCLIEVQMATLETIWYLHGADR